jgi:DMSO reductase anchor subunit
MRLPVVLLFAVFVACTLATPDIQADVGANGSPVAAHTALQDVRDSILPRGAAPGQLSAIIVLGIEVVLHLLRPRKFGTIRHEFASVTMCIVFMFLPTWVSTTLSLFECVPLDKPVAAPFQAEAVGSWWVEDMS